VPRDLSGAECPYARPSVTVMGEPRFLVFGKSGWIGGLVIDELKHQVRLRRLRAYDRVPLAAKQGLDRVRRSAPRNPRESTSARTRTASLA
jgi:hypothetical protein